MNYSNFWISKESTSGWNKIKFSGKRLYLSDSIKYLGVKIGRFLHCYNQVNSIAVKLNKANALLEIM